MVGVPLPAFAFPGEPLFSRTEVVGAAMLAGLLLLSLQFVRRWTTVAHEGGHALFAALLGGSVVAVRLGIGVGAVTEWIGAGWLIKIVVSLTGYLGPAIFGLAAAVLLRAGRPDIVLWGSVALLAVFLLFARNWRAVVAIVSLGFVILLLLRRAGGDVQGFAALTWAWILLIGAVVDVFGLRSYRREAKLAGGDSDSDAAVLRKLTFIPAALWVLVFFVGALAALTVGASFLLDMSLGLFGV